MMAIAAIIPVAKWLSKIKQRSDVSCRLSKRAREQRSASIVNLPEETYGHSLNLNANLKRPDVAASMNSSI